MTDGGTASIPTGTASRTFTLSLTPTWIRISMRRSGHKQSTGFVYPSGQWSYSRDANASSSAIELRDNSDTIVLQGTFTSFGTNQVTFNITTNTLASSQQIGLEFGN